MKKTCIIAAMSLGLLLAGCSGDEWSTKTVNVYTGSTDAESTGSVTALFRSEAKNIPYLAPSTLLPEFHQDCDVIDENGVLTLKNNATNATVVADVAKNTIVFSDYYKVFGNTSAPNPMSSEVDPSCFQQTSVSYEGKSRTVSLDDYSLKMYTFDGRVVMPAATFFDLYEPNYKFSYNGSDFYRVDGIYDDQLNLTEYGQSFKNVPTSYTYDNNLRNFAYHELCLSLDFNYEMTTMLKYPSFEELLVTKGIKDKIFDGEPSATKWDDGLNLIFNDLLNDNGHTGIYRSSSNVFLKEATDASRITRAATMKQNSDVCDAIEAKRTEKEISVGTIEDYVESDKTYIVNFDEFAWYSQNEDGSYNKEGEDSASLIYKANNYLQEHLDQVDNVIIDLTCNGGGEDSAELQLSSWIHGEAYQYCYGEKAYGKAVSKYVCDVNMDGKYDSKDNINGKKIYLLTSNYSYSNANVFSGEMKGTANVTLIGQKTGGGSCNVLQFSSVMGNFYRLSSLTRAVNANWDSIETGVEPDIEINDSDLSKLADQLTDYRSIIDEYIAK